MIGGALVLALSIRLTVGGDPPGEMDPAAVPQAIDEGPNRDAQGLNLGDLGPYRAALEQKPGDEAVPVSFRELWEAPGRLQGKRVRVEGRVLRRFRQGAFGTFPPLVEAWAVAPSGDPYCLVFPDPNPGEPPKSPEEDAAPGALVQFEGVFLRQIRYQGGDSPRLAPLIVGGGPPAITTAAPGPVSIEDPGVTPTGTPSWWTFGFITAGLIALVLARRHLRQYSREPSRSRRELDPPPEFIESGLDP